MDESNAEVLKQLQKLCAAVEAVSQRMETVETGFAHVIEQSREAKGQQESFLKKFADSSSSLEGSPTSPKAALRRATCDYIGCPQQTNYLHGMFHATGMCPDASRVSQVEDALPGANLLPPTPGPSPAEGRK